jgi:hypothetical protein
MKVMETEIATLTQNYKRGVILKGVGLITMLGSIVLIIFLYSKLQKSYGELEIAKRRLAEDSIKLTKQVQIQTSKLADNQVTIQRTTLKPDQKEYLKKLAETTIDTNKKEVSNNTAVKVEDSILSNQRNLPNLDVKIISEIQTTSALTTPKVLPNYVLTGSPETQYCKSGYYIIFNGTLKIGVNSLNASTGQVSVRITNAITGVEISANLDMAISQPLPVVINEIQYKITLNYIGAAGKNPFTKAAYFTVAMYKKN